MFDRLSSPLPLGPTSVKNRVMQLATSSLLDDGGKVGPRLIAFYEERAKGGVGAIVAAQPGRLASNRECIAGFSSLAQAIHRHGTVLIAQLHHGGRQHHKSAFPLLVGPSAIACPHSGGTPHPLSLEEIDALVADFIGAACNMREAGLDGVEVHGGQGHLIQEFLSPFSNQRQDRYGGSLENRMRFAVRIIEGIRKKCGNDFVVGFRLGAEEFTPGGLTFDEAQEIARRLTAARNIDYFSVTQSNFNSIETHTPDRRYPFAPFIDFAARIKEIAGGIPVVASGRIVEPERAEEILAQGKADLIGLSRPLLADPEWFSKAAAGHPEHIRRCISCNQCWGWVITQQPIGCIQNAACGNELQWGSGTLRQASARKNVVVVGGGPAGLETARIAAVRGHKITLFEESQRLGGALLEAASVPEYEEIGWIVDYLEGSVRDAGVEIRLGSRAIAAEIVALRPQAVVVATGSERRKDGLQTDGLPMYDGHDVLVLGVDTGRAAIILDEDGYYAPCAIAEKVARSGTVPYLVTRFFEVGREIPATSRITTLRKLDSLGAILIPTAWPTAVHGHRVTLQHYLSKREWEIDGIDCIIDASNRVPRDMLVHELKGLVDEVHCIGDAYMPRRISDAIREGHRVGREL